jgi:hypothetical protein
MAATVAHSATDVNPLATLCADDGTDARPVPLHMARRGTKWEPPPIRLHRINEWAEARGMDQADIVRETGIDKTTVWRWFAGAVPRHEHLERLVALFALEEPNDLFMHPDNDWLARRLRGQPREDVERAKMLLDIMLSNKVA